MNDSQRNLDSRVKAVWSRTQSRHVSAGILAFCRWAIPMFLIGMAIDWLAHLPAPGRVAILVILLGVSLCKAWRAGWRHVRLFNPVRTALQIEEHHGELESLLVAAIQFRAAESAHGTSEALREVTFRRAEEAAAPLRPQEIVGFQVLRRPATAALVLAATIGVFAVLNGPFLSAGLARIFAPWLAVQYPTRTQLELVQGDLVVKEGHSARIEARVSGVIPSRAKLALRTGKGQPRLHTLDITDGACEYTIDAAFRSFEYRIRAGDARSPWHRVEVISSPRVEQVKVDLEFPSYIDRQPESVEALTLAVPEGTRIKWRLTLDRPVSQAKVSRVGEESRPLEVSPDGRIVTMNEVAIASRAYSFEWVEKAHGFTFTSPRHFLQVSPDQPPRLELTSPVGNLYAILGRPVDLRVRCSDDHGLAAPTIAYRVKLRPEKTVALTKPILNQGGEQRLDWDYRKAVTNLEIGDTVSFAVEISDRYPGEEGPHRVRSEARRITFLSREDYLKRVAELRNRLLTRLRALYRQERAAHDLVRKLDPYDSVFMQTCQLEAVRQEMIRERLKMTVREVQHLIDDLAANNVSDAPEGEALDLVRTGLSTIAETHVARAASLLRTQTSASFDDESATPDPAPAALVVNTAAREMGSLVLQSGIDSALEVFARELHMYAQTQATLRLQTLDTRTAAAGNGAETLAKQQEALAGWAARLFSDLQAGLTYTKRPLAVLGLSRRIKDLRAAKVEAKMQESAALIRKGSADHAASLQSDVIRALLKQEFRVRTGAEYQALLTARKLFDSLASDQKELRASSEALPADQFANRRSAIAGNQAALRRKLLLALLPTAPAPRPQLFDPRAPQPPPVGDLLNAAERAMAEAVAQTIANKRDAALAEQLKVEEPTGTLAGIINRWATEVALKTQGLSTTASEANEHETNIEKFESRQIGLIEKTDEAAAGEKSCTPIVEPQKILIGDVERFRKEVARQQNARQDEELKPLLSRLDQVIRAMKGVLPPLKENRADEAIEKQEVAAEALLGALEFAQARSSNLGKMQDLIAFQNAVGYANSFMADIVAEQRDLIAAIEAAKPAGLPGLIPAQENLHQCLIDVAPLLDLVADRLDVGTPLVFSQSDIEDAVLSLKDNDPEDAVDALSAAADSLAEVHALVKDMRTQVGYIVEVVEFLKSSLGDGVSLAFRQEQLRQKAQAAKGALPAAIIDEQRALHSAAVTFGQQLLRATGSADYSAAAKSMNDAMGRINGDVPAAAEQMGLAEEALNTSATELSNLISMLHGLPDFAVTEQSPPEVRRLFDVLALASEQRQLYRRSQAAVSEATGSLAEKLRELKGRCKAFTQTEQPHPKLVAAHRHLSAAVTALKPSSRDEAIASQQAAGMALRHFILDQALLLDTAKVAAGPSDPGDPAGDSASDAGEKLVLMASFVSDFVSGERPKDQRSEWEVLGRRTRAALNENFARELPLEYRGLLKNYYERVAK